MILEDDEEEGGARSGGASRGSGSGGGGAGGGAGPTSPHNITLGLGGWNEDEGVDITRM